ncbi:putative A Receptor for Ubiquitination Targets [Lyophyllum shimeji]|uniref:A Receptor for Ubiquitination Targets n=1 Tax=Lyophyllum shimeji TaxID=47721 RepID=A0A9P3PLK2_LYOSH|nr:putative A Receptor for Ubiquitination Targets [Lyophyllum shimeji]
MSKRSLSPAPLPDAKRLHTSGHAANHGLPQNPRLSFNDSLYDELVLCIFSHLSWVDLCAAQATSRNWYRLASDNELWRKLYIRVFGRSRLRGSRGYVTRSDGREVKPLPGWAAAKQEPVKDWKWMFRISSNWKRGRCTIEEFNQILPSLRAPQPELSCETHVLLAGPLTIIASSRPSDLPTINLSAGSNTNHKLICQSRLRGGPFQITALAIDQSPPLHGHLRLFASLSTGEFNVFSINPTQLSASVRVLTYVPSRGRPRNSPIIQAVYYHPLLITLSQEFALSLYDLSGDGVKHTQTLRSFISFPPTSLVLSTPSPTTYKLVLAYTIPVYPAHWSVGATELIISGPGSSTNVPTPLAPPSSLSDISQPSVEPMCVVSSRTTRALDIPPGWIDEDKLRSMREQWGRKVSRVTDTQTDGKWVVLAPAETASAAMSSTPFSSVPQTINTHDASFLNSSTTLQLYRLYLPASNSIASSPPKLTFVRSLHGQTGPIASLADGRCVSLGFNGSLWVWDLEAGTGAESLSTRGESSRPRQIGWSYGGSTCDACLKSVTGPIRTSQSTTYNITAAVNLYLLVPKHSPTNSQPALWKGSETSVITAIGASELCLLAVAFSCP